MSITALWRVWFVAVVVGVGLVMHFNPASDSAAVADHKPTKPGLALPVLPAPMAEGDRIQAAQSFPWGADARAPMAEEPTPRWLTGGSLGAGDRRRLLLRFENDKWPERFVGVGDTLPDGRKVIALERLQARVRSPDSDKEVWTNLADLQSEDKSSR